MTPFRAARTRSVARSVLLTSLALGGLFSACSADTANPKDAVRQDTKPNKRPRDANDGGTAGRDEGAVSDAQAPDAQSGDASDAASAASAEAGAAIQLDAAPVSPATDAVAPETDGEDMAVVALDAAAPATDVEDDAVDPDVECQAASYVFTPDIVNARDLGGVPLEQGATSCGMVFRGPPLTPLSDERCAEFEALGIRTVIDLRVESERTTKPDAPCVTDNANLVLAPLPVPYEVSPANYVTDLNTVDSMSTIFHTLGDPDAYPVYMHCTYGRDRTGVVAAAILLALGAAPDAIHAEYVLSGDSVGAYPESLQAVLDEVEARGGVNAYLADLGIGAAEIAVLRERLSASGK